MTVRRLLLALAAVGCIAAAADPAERLHDPAQEARARAIFAQVRCLVCQNESIDDSEADLARDLRREVRTQIAAGRSDAEVKAFMVAHYGEFAMLRPSFSASNAALWGAPFLVALIGATLLILRKRSAAATEVLTPQEEARIQALRQDETR